MDRYWDLSVKERAELTAEQVEAMLTVELMEKGIVKIEKPDLEVVEEIEVDRTVYYTVEHDGKYSSGTAFDCVFRTIEQAQAFIELNPLWQDYDYSIGEQYRYAKPATGLKIVTKQYCDEADVLQVNTKLQQIAATKKANEAKLTAYNVAAKKIHDATKGIWDDWRTCRSTKHEYQKIIDTLDEYTGICDGNESKALVFLRKAYDESDISAALAWFGRDCVAVEA